MSQTGAYTRQAARGAPGLLGDSGHDMFIQSYGVETAAVEFGRGVEAGTDPENQVVAYAGGTLQGVTVKTHALDRATEEAGLDGASVGEEVGVLRKGRIWVQTNEAVVAGDAVFCVNTGADAGRFRNDATDATAVPGAAFAGFDADRSLALLELNLPA